MNSHKYLFGVLAVGLVIAALVLGYFFLIADSSDDNDVADTSQEQETVVVDGLDSYFQWCATTVPTVIQDVVVDVVSGTKTAEQAQEETRSLFASVTPPEELATIHNTNAEFLALIWPGYVGASERSEDGNQDFETLIFNALDSGSQTRVRELVEEGRTAYSVLPDATKTAAQAAGCSLFDDPFAGTTS